MQTILRKLLARPTWQVFLLLFIPELFGETWIAYTLAYIWFFAAIGFIYGVGNALYDKLPAEHDLNLAKFQFHFLFAFEYIIAFNILFRHGYSAPIFFLLPFHLYAMYCLFYLIWFVAKSIATIENGRVVGFDFYSGNFFLLWFFPLGIWWMHPKIRKILLTEPPVLSDLPEIK